ncbi:MAG: hypothetical protein IKX26_06525 [Bacteroidales bacterium]|nr:hypothetical protein [Bacteroidales bacterium]
MRFFLHRCLFLLAALASCINSHAQNVEIRVKIGEDSAPYSIVKSNGNILGVADSIGRLFVPYAYVNRGDTLSAGYSDFDSDKVIYDGASKRVSLIIKELVLSRIFVKSDNLYRLKEYLKLFKNHKYHYKTDFHIYSSQFNICYVNYRYMDIDTNSLAECESEIAFRPYHRRVFGVYNRTIYFTDKDYYMILNPPNTSEFYLKSVGINAFNIAYASDILYRLSNRKMLSEALSKRELLIHKFTDREGKVSYAFFEGDNRENQTIVTLDTSGTRIGKIVRKFIGSGKGWKGDSKLEHTVTITPEYGDNTIQIKDIATKLKDAGLDVSFEIFTYNISNRKASLSQQSKLSRPYLKSIFLE